MPLPTLTLELSAWKGLNTFSPETEMEPIYVADCQNVDFDEGVISKRRGARNAGGTLNLTQPINLIFDFQSQQGFTSASDRIRTVIVSGAVLYVVKLFNQDGETIEATFSTTNALHYGAVANNGAAYISHENGGEVPKVLCYTGGAWRFETAALDAPVAAPAVAVGSAGTPSGVYQVCYTYEDIFGNESNPSPVSTTVSVTSEEVSVGVVASGLGTVNLINLYVLTPSGTEYQFSRTASNTTGTISHTVSDATVNSADIVGEDHYPCPKGKYVAIYNDMLLVAGDASLPDIIRVSNFQYHRQFAETDLARAVTGDGQPIRGFGRAFNQLVIGKSDALFLGDGADNTTFNARPHNQEYGVLGQPSMTFVDQKLAFFSDDGIYVDDSLVPREISRIIRKTMRQLNPANLACSPPKQFAANDKYYKRLFWSVREATGAGENDALLVWNYEQDAWTKYKSNAARYLASVQNQDDYEFMYGGDNSGHLWQYTPPNGGSPNSDNIGGVTTSITAYVETPWLNLPKLKGMSDWERVQTIPRYVKLYVTGEPASGNSTISMVTTYYTDFQTTVRGTFTTTHSATAWPTITEDPKTIYYGGNLGTFKWVKFRFTNALQDEHFRITKVVLGFKAKPAVD